MNSDAVKTNETNFAGELKEKWGALTDADLEGIAGRKGPLVDKLQERYGYDKEQAEKEADEFLRSHPESNGPPAGPASPASRTKAPDQARATMSEVYRNEPSSVDAKHAAETAAMPAAGYSHSVTIWISPRVLRWIRPIAVAALVVLLFLPWTGAYPSGYAAYTQNAFQTIWGGVSVDTVATKSLDSAKPFDNVPKDPLMFLYILLVALALALVLAPLVLTPARLQAYHPFVQYVWRRRVGLFGLTALLSLTLLMIQMAMGFGFEAAVAAKTDNNQATELAAAKTPDDRERAKIQRGLEASSLNMSRTLWFHLAVACNTIFFVAAGLEFWLKRRGDRPLPRIDAHA